MPDRLEQMLRTAAREVDFPPTPDLPGAVARELRAPAPRRPARMHPIPRALVLAALTLLVAAATVLAASPGARDAVLEFFGIRGASVEVVPRVPDVPPTSTPVGERVSLADARRRAGFEVLLPRRGRVRDARFSERVPGGVVSFTLRGVAVTQVRAGVERDFLGKLVAEGTRVDRLRVGGERALWLVGRPHVVFLRDANGRVVEESLRRAGDVLLVERGELVVRVEGARSLRAARAVARSLR